MTRKKKPTCKYCDNEVVIITHEDTIGLDGEKFTELEAKCNACDKRYVL